VLPLLANAEILPQARQGSYFFNRISQLRSFSVYQRKDDSGRLGGTPMRLWLRWETGHCPVSFCYYRACPSTPRFSGILLIAEPDALNLGFSIRAQTTSKHLGPV
jgi:hypothetical protein